MNPADSTRQRSSNPGCMASTSFVRSAFTNSMNRSACCGRGALRRFGSSRRVGLSIWSEVETRPKGAEAEAAEGGDEAAIKSKKLGSRTSNWSGGHNCHSRGVLGSGRWLRFLFDGTEGFGAICNVRKEQVGQNVEILE